ncbi:hypothetical protein PR048_027469 [Dryococelus australis]|uniref:Uncharacterized protein n=1 Tax=Dryococelus australis TaxID=614101 RepID=A0ABQ9GFJ4_9NEOP|nr:hypothetical protein PR048_027469 [Dryococelus australis]
MRLAPAATLTSVRTTDRARLLLPPQPQLPQLADLEDTTTRISLRTTDWTRLPPPQLQLAAAGRLLVCTEGSSAAAAAGPPQLPPLEDTTTRISLHTMDRTRLPPPQLQLPQLADLVCTEDLARLRQRPPQLPPLEATDIRITLATIRLEPCCRGLQLCAQAIYNILCTFLPGTLELCFGVSSLSLDNIFYVRRHQK